MNKRLDELKRNRDTILSRVKEHADRAHRSMDELQVLCVSKLQSVEDVLMLYQLGQRDFAENRPELLAERVATLPEAVSQEINWHQIGTIQRRKIREIASINPMIHSLDRLSLAKALNEMGQAQQRSWSCLIQVNGSQEEQKHGISLEELPRFLESIREFEHLKLLGLMTMAEAHASESRLHQTFAAVREARESIRSQAGLLRQPELFQELSMGMSDDYLIAIEEGATILRIGRAFFQ